MKSADLAIENRLNHGLLVLGSLKHNNCQASTAKFPKKWQFLHIKTLKVWNAILKDKSNAIVAFVDTEYVALVLYTFV